MRKVLLALTWLFVSTAAWAEFQLDLYGGNASTKATHLNVYVWSTPVESSTERIDDSSMVYGVRGITWLDSMPWLGFGWDLYQFSSDGPDVGIDNTVSALDIMARYRFGDQWYPYVGIGPSVSYSDVEFSETSNIGRSLDEESIAYGWDLRTGVNWAIDRSLGVFAEYRYSRLKIDIEKHTAGWFWPSYTTMDINGRLKTDHYIVGISFKY